MWNLVLLFQDIIQPNSDYTEMLSKNLRSLQSTVLENLLLLQFYYILYKSRVRIDIRMIIIFYYNFRVLAALGSLKIHTKYGILDVI